MEAMTPNIEIAHQGPMLDFEHTIIQNMTTIEAWFRKQWMKTPAPITSSVDLRNSGFKLAPVDTNLFPAGFNNLNDDFLPLCIQAVQSTLAFRSPGCVKILIIPELHTRNKFYAKSLSKFKSIFEQAGFVVRLGHFAKDIQKAIDIETVDGESLTLEAVIRQDNRLMVDDFNPCLLLLNNDLSSGIPEILTNVEQPILPSPQLGWSSRYKSDHFHFFSDVVEEFSQLINIDPWLLNPLCKTINGVDFMAQEGLDKLADNVDELLQNIQKKYNQHGIMQQPFVAIKSDSGTYGMSVMMAKSGGDILNLNRKQRTKMSASKGGNKVEQVIIQEGVYTFETMPDGAVAEPVLYMIGQFVVGGFYRVHQGRGDSENLNAPGMHFEPLAFEKPCNTPFAQAQSKAPNRFYVYGVVSRLAALAAARESV